MEILQQFILGTYLTLFFAATLLDIFFTLRGDYDYKREVVGMAQPESTFL